MKTISDLKNSISGLLTGTNLRNVTNLYGAIERAIRVMATQIDIPEASGRENINLYDGVYDYLAPTSIFGGALNDLRPQGVTRSSYDVVYRTPILQFDTTKALVSNGYQLTFEYDKGVPLMRVAQHKSTPKVILDTMTSNDGWTTTGITSGLSVDEAVYYQQPASLRFTLDTTVDGILQKTISSVDISNFNNVGVVFLALYLPTATPLTNIKLDIGSDSSNYYSVTSTSGFLGAFQSGKFALISFDLAGAPATGSPDLSKATFIRLTFVHSAQILNVRVGGLFISLPSPHELLFQSAYIFSVSGVLSNTITDDNDQIILNDSAYTLLEYEGAAQVCFQQGGDLSSGSLQTITQKLYGGGPVKLGLYDMYKADNPSQEIRVGGTYYDV